MQLGLPIDRPLIMTGHQAEFWHPGILAKYLAADAAAGVIEADVAWLVVDQDRPEAVTVRYPVQDAQGRLTARSWILERGPAMSPLGSLPDTDHVAACVRAGLDEIGSVMSRHASEVTLPRQVAAGIGDLLHPLLRHRTAPPTIFATELNRTVLFRELADRMAREPERCVGAYNAAVARHSSAGMRPLLADDIQDRFELPLWWLPPGGPRQHVYAEMLGQIPLSELAPKALFMTGLLRLAGCDLFIHGTGGGGAEGEAAHEGYDLVTDEWLAVWLGITRDALAPITVVSATRFLPLEAAEPPAPSVVDRAEWMSNSARHSPYLLRDSYFDDAKRSLVAQIAAASGTDRARLFRRMHAVLAEYRQVRDADLRGLREHAATLVARAANGPVLHDRTWPFPLYPQRVLAELAGQIDARFRPAS